MASRDDDFLARWSRRKAEARGGLSRSEDAAARPDPAPSGLDRRGRASADAGPVKAARLADDAAADPVRSFAEELRREEEAPVAAVNNTPSAREDEFASLTEEERERFADVDFDKLTPDDDFSRFMQEDVPEIVRRRALRALWSHPVISSVDRLNDYDEDFTDAALAVKAIVSSYKPGSGYLTDEERARFNMDEGEASTGAAEVSGREDRRAEAAEADETAGDGEEDIEPLGDADGDAGEVADADHAAPDGDARERDEKG